MIWKPNTTVAAVIERDGRFLLVEEKTADGLRFNQPAGHWEPGETLIAASIRETLEESAYDFEPQHLIGIYSWRTPKTGLTYLRFAFSGIVTNHHPERMLDEGIVRAAWLTPDEIQACPARSPLVLRCTEDYLAGKRYPLDILLHYE